MGLSGLGRGVSHPGQRARSQRGGKRQTAVMEKHHGAGWKVRKCRPRVLSRHHPGTEVLMAEQNSSSRVSTYRDDLTRADLRFIQASRHFRGTLPCPNTLMGSGASYLLLAWVNQLLCSALASPMKKNGSNYSSGKTLHSQWLGRAGHYWSGSAGMCSSGINHPWGKSLSINKLTISAHTQDFCVPKYWRCFAIPILGEGQRKENGKQFGCKKAVRDLGQPSPS